MIRNREKRLITVIKKIKYDAASKGEQRWIKEMV